MFDVRVEAAEFGCGGEGRSSERTREGRSPGRECPDKRSSWKQRMTPRSPTREKVGFAIPNVTAGQKANTSVFRKSETISSFLLLCRLHTYKQTLTHVPFVLVIPFMVFF